MNIYVLHYDGENKHPEYGDMYLQAARALAKSREKKLCFANDHSTLEIETSYKYRSIAYIFGIEFTATFHCEHGSHTIKYIVQRHALDGDNHIGVALSLGGSGIPAEIIYNGFN